MNQRHIGRIFVGTAAFFLSVALAGFTTPAQAVDCENLPAGTIFQVKGSSSVFLVTEEGGKKGRAYFRNSEDFHTWHENFDGLKTIEPACTSLYSKVSVVTPRPGSLLVKTVFSPDVYAIGPNKTLIKIGSEEVAKGLYGDKWATLVRDVPENFLAYFTESDEPLTEAVPHDGMVIQKTGSNAYYFVHKGTLIRIKTTPNEKVKVKVYPVTPAIFTKLPINGKVSVDDDSITADPEEKHEIELGEPVEMEDETEIETEIEDEDEDNTNDESNSSKNDAESKTDYTLPVSATNPNGVLTEKGTIGTGAYIGQDVFIKPIGTTGEWLFGAQVEWRMKKECGSGVSYQGSTGAEYDKGVEHGINNALFDKDLLFPIYWPTPPAGGSAEYNKGYKYGYENTYSGVFVRKVDCPAPISLANFNKQGWKRETPKDLHISFSLPPYPLVSDVRAGNTGDTLIGYQTSGVTVGQVQVITLPWTKFAEQVQFAKWKKDYNAGTKLNIDAIEIAELNANGEKQDVAAMKVAYYNGIKAGLKSCVVGDAEYSEETLGNKKVHGVAFVVACTKGSGQTAQQHITYFIELHNKNVVLVHFKNQNELWNGTELDLSKLSNSMFRKQFLTYLTDTSK